MVNWLVVGMECGDFYSVTCEFVFLIATYTYHYSVQ